MERRIEKDFDDEIEAERKASTFSLLKSRKFLLIYCMSITEFIYPMYFNAIFKEIGQYYIDDDDLLTKIGSIAQAFNSLFRFGSGFILDYVSAKKLNYVVIVTMIIQLLTLSKNLTKLSIQINLSSLTFVM